MMGSMQPFNFVPAFEEERFVFGAQRPGFDSRAVGPETVMEWVSFMKGQGIERVCCLLPDNQLVYYTEDLLKTYDREFGRDNVLWAPVPDFHLCDIGLLKEKIFPFFDESVAREEPVVLHCSKGTGRTGHILAAWLVYKHHLTVDEALESVIDMGRNPYAAVQHGIATEDDLRWLLLQCED